MRKLLFIFLLLPSAITHAQEFDYAIEDLPLVDCYDSREIPYDRIDTVVQLGLWYILHVWKGDQDNVFLEHSDEERTRWCVMSDDLFDDPYNLDLFGNTVFDKDVVFITHKYYFSRNGWSGGLHESYTELALFDRQKERFIFHEMIESSFEWWGNTTEEDEDGDIYIVDSETEYDCYTYQLLIQENAMCLSFVQEECSEDALPEGYFRFNKSLRQLEIWELDHDELLFYDDWIELDYN